jgi:hypothetical protein
MPNEPSPEQGRVTPPAINELLEKILEVRATLHAAGAISADALAAIARHANARTVRNSVETGCGATTLLLSHLSQNHTAFALDVGSSVANVRRSPLLQPGVVSFIEGPSQHTLPRHRFPENLQLALIDGPHAYPFPDLEYYFLYPHLDAGALLIVDDIQIRSIHNLFDFLRRDAMFRLDDVVRTTAFFTRTGVPTFDPTGDGWSRQRYNEHALLRYEWKSKLASVLPASIGRRLDGLRYRLRHGGSGCSVEITSPAAGRRVAEAGIVEGAVVLSGDAHLWVLVHRKDVAGWWPQGDGAVPVSQSPWSAPVKYGGIEDAGYDFEIAAVVVRRPVHERWLEWVQSVRETGSYPPVQLPGAGALLAEARRIVTKKPLQDDPPA